jgi:hypothetical protein
VTAEPNISPKRPGPPKSIPGSCAPLSPVPGVLEICGAAISRPRRSLAGLYYQRPMWAPPLSQCRAKWAIVQITIGSGGGLGGGIAGMLGNEGEVVSIGRARNVPVLHL